MWVAAVLHRPAGPVPVIPASSPNPKLYCKQQALRFGDPFRPKRLEVSASKKQLSTQKPEGENGAEVTGGEEFDLGWLPALPHGLLASMSNFLFGYHIGVMNGPIVSIARELGFEGNSLLEGLVVSIFVIGAFIGSISSGSLCDKLGCRRTFQIDTIPLVLGAIIRWRTILYIASVPAFIVAFGMQFAVESPRWLYKVGRLNDARTTIQNLWGSSEVDKVVEEFQSVIRKNGSDLDSKWLELLEEPHLRVAFIGGALFVLQQFAGINGVLYFSSLTFKDEGITSGPFASFLGGITNFAGSISALYLVDKQGRQRLLIGSYLGMAVSMFLVVYGISSAVDEQLGHNLSILGTVMYIFTFALGAGPVTGLIISELSSNRTRGKIMGFSLSVHWVCNFVVGLFFLELVEKFGVASVYASFGGISILSAIFAYYFLVETKGRSLEEIEISLDPKFASKDD
ncbi:probable plastidic glucose transporter 1 isoform X2 [Malania oleifera]|uniref:probable plastidic glucose transporter 1 isoform X2 n=1 Tax=Malania oleifera TaxID=397392 RepID=UPI0025AE3A2C|nr:probable plastidic glucose transporter 1 isoform X2 [Malania oleifera]